MNVGLLLNSEGMFNQCPCVCLKIVEFPKLMHAYEDHFYARNSNLCEMNSYCYNVCDVNNHF